MGKLSDWWESRHTCPEYIYDFRCDKLSLTSSKTTIMDWWLFAHLFWGMVYSIPIFFIDDGWSALICFSLAVLYEIIENTELGVYIAEIICCSPGYQGDNFWNSVMDVTFNMLGFCIMLIIKYTY